MTQFLPLLLLQLVYLVLIEHFPEVIMLQQVILLLVVLQLVQEATGADHKVAFLAVVRVERGGVLFVEDGAHGADERIAEVQYLHIMVAVTLLDSPSKVQFILLFLG